MTTSPSRSPVISVVALCTVTALALALITVTADLRCIPEYLNGGPTGKFAAILRTVEYAVRLPLSTLLLLTGFGVLAACIACSPYLFPPKTSGRLVATFGPVALVLGGVLWAAVMVPTAGCDGGWNGGKIMLQIVTGGIFWLVLILIAFRSDRTRL